MNNKIIKTIKLLRPKQWIKNFAIFAAIVFTGELFDPPVFFRVLVGFFVFCGLSSAIYIVNDIFDVEKDRLHPFKKFRPLANKDLSIRYAVVLAAILATSSLILSTYVAPAFLVLVLVYLILQVLYSMSLKDIEILDILTLAAGYILRVYAGETASGYHISVWLVLTTVALSLFIAVGKRRSELTLISHIQNINKDAVRKTLSHYSERLLDVYASIFATATFISYSYFTFLENPQGIKIGISFFMPDFLPATFQRKWLMITILPVVYGLMRYLQDIYEKHEGESPEKVLLSDIPLLAAVIMWALLVVFIIYVIGG